MIIRVLAPWREWRGLRSRLHEEHTFHLVQAAADLRGLGLSARAARREAQLRFGGRRNLIAARRELGCDLPGFAFLLRAHRVAASRGFQPLVLLTAMLMIFGVSPRPREIVEGVIGRTLNSANSGAVVLSAQPLGGLYQGITPGEFRALQSMTSLTSVRQHGLNAGGFAAPGAQLKNITAEAQAKTHNRGFYAAWASDQTIVSTAPAKVIWVLIAFVGSFFLRHSWFYAVGLGFLHAAASLVLWAFLGQICGRFLLVAFVGYLVLTAAQCRWWWGDLKRRCPICLDGLVMSLTTGVSDRLLFSPITAESICAHGHGTMVESWWSRSFR